MLTSPIAKKKDWTLGDWIANFLQEDAYYYDDDGAYDDYYEDDGSAGGGMTGSDGQPMGGDGADDYSDEGVLESLVILGLAATIVFLMYYRAQRQQAHRERVAREDAARRQQEQQNQNQNQNQNHNPPAAQRGAGINGFFPGAGAPPPGFAPWAAPGGVGH